MIKVYAFLKPVKVKFLTKAYISRCVWDVRDKLLSKPWRDHSLFHRGLNNLCISIKWQDSFEKYWDSNNSSLTVKIVDGDSFFKGSYIHPTYLSNWDIQPCQDFIILFNSLKQPVSRKSETAKTPIKYWSCFPNRFYKSSFSSGLSPASTNVEELPDHLHFHTVKLHLVKEFP